MGYGGLRLECLGAAYPFGAWSGTYGADVANDLATPWLGVIERVCAFSYQLWIGVFAIAVLARPFCGTRGAGAGLRS